MRRVVEAYLTLLLISVIVFMGVLIWAHEHPAAKCTHGLSSIGPVTIDKAGNVTGDTTPHTEACLP